MIVKEAYLMHLKCLLPGTDFQLDKVVRVATDYRCPSEFIQRLSLDDETVDENRLLRVCREFSIDPTYLLREIGNSVYCPPFIWTEEMVKAVIMTLFTALEHAVNMLRRRMKPAYFSDVAFNVEVSSGYPLPLFRFR